VAEIVSSFIVPELSRMYHKEHLEDAENRHIIAAQQVTDAVFSAHQTVRDIIEDMDSNTNGRQDRGVNAMEGGMVNEAIKNAVYAAMKKSIGIDNENQKQHEKRNEC